MINRLMKIIAIKCSNFKPTTEVSAIPGAYRLTSSSGHSANDSPVNIVMLPLSWSKMENLNIYIIKLLIFIPVFVHFQNTAFQLLFSSS